MAIKQEGKLTKRAYERKLKVYLSLHTKHTTGSNLVSLRQLKAMANVLQIKQDVAIEFEHLKHERLVELGHIQDDTRQTVEYFEGLYSARW